MTPSRWIHPSGIYNFARCLHSFSFIIIARIIEIDELIKMTVKISRVYHKFLTFNLKDIPFYSLLQRVDRREREIVSCDLQKRFFIQLIRRGVIKSKFHPRVWMGKVVTDREWNFEKLHRVRRREETEGLAIKCDERTCQLQAENLQRP